MYKLSTLIIALLTLASCSPTVRQEQDMGLLSTHNMVRQQFQGHSYIVTKGLISPAHTLHDPDCGCDKGQVTGPTFPVTAHRPGAPLGPVVLPPAPKVARTQATDIQVHVPKSDVITIPKPVVTVNSQLLASVER